MISLYFSQRFVAIACTLVFFCFVFYQNSIRHSTVLHITSSQTYGAYGRNTLLSHIQNETLGFQKIYSIGLPSRTDRRDSTLLAAALTGFKPEFVDGVEGKTITDRSLPPGAEALNYGERGCWRAHLNVWAKMVENNVATALIMEDDGDWDLRLKHQLSQFAVGIQAISKPTNLGGLGSRVGRSHFSLRSLRSSRSFKHAASTNTGDKPLQIDYNDLLAEKTISHSPYGDDWELLWFGHCVSRFPSNKYDDFQTARVVLHDDPTVIPLKNYKRLLPPEEWEQEYGEKTRVYHHSVDQACTLGYAITQSAARKMLYEFGVEETTVPVDLQMRNWCSGLYGYSSHSCWTTTPSLFEHWRPRGKSAAHSDIRQYNGITNQSYSNNIMQSAKMNMKRLIDNPAILPRDQYSR